MKNKEMETRHINDLLKRLDSEFSMEDIIVILNNCCSPIAKVSQNELLQNMLVILQNNDKKAEVVGKIFNTFCSVKKTYAEDGYNPNWPDAPFVIDTNIPKKLADNINLRADEIRLKNNCKQEKADELYEELTR